MKKRINAARSQKDDESRHDAVSVVVQSLDLHPECVHGPTILFKRITDKTGSGREFFACSASRDRSGCSFFLWKDQKMSSAKRDEWRKRQESWVSEKSALFQGVVSEKSRKNKSFCLECQVVFESNTPDHKGHQVKEIGPSDWARPTRLLSALSASKREAQYHFTESSVATILEAARSNGKTHLLCIGAPTLHEAARASASEFQSLLMDIDHRLGLFLDSSEFCWYGLFNHHFFLESHQKVYDTFLKEAGDGLLVITDPPFGGKCELISETLRKVETRWKALNGSNLESTELSVIWIYPYFMETSIISVFPSLIMCDYKVNYTDHPTFREGGLSRGSPVRLFTNLPLKKVRLPEDEGYRLCPDCDRWVSRNNLHCYACAACTSKNGGAYTHCSACGRCVKTSWRHCESCGRCALPQHPCHRFQEKALAQMPNKKRK